jgi:hypothetical protein
MIVRALILLSLWIAGILIQLRFCNNWWDNNRSKGCGCHSPMDEASLLKGVLLAVSAFVWLLLPFVAAIVYWFSGFQK